MRPRKVTAITLTTYNRLGEPNPSGGEPYQAQWQHDLDHKDAFAESLKVRQVQLNKAQKAARYAANTLKNHHSSVSLNMIANNKKKSAKGRGKGGKNDKKTQEPEDPELDRLTKAAKQAAATLEQVKKDNERYQPQWP